VLPQLSQKSNNFLSALSVHQRTNNNRSVLDAPRRPRNIVAQSLELKPSLQNVLSPSSREMRHNKKQLLSLNSPLSEAYSITPMILSP
jgi:hypothetical protein